MATFCAGKLLARSTARIAHVTGHRALIWVRELSACCWTTRSRSPARIRYGWQHPALHADFTLQAAISSSSACTAAVGLGARAVVLARTRTHAVPFVAGGTICAVVIIAAPAGGALSVGAGSCRAVPWWRRRRRRPAPGGGCRSVQQRHQRQRRKKQRCARRPHFSHLLHHLCSLDLVNLRPSSKSSIGPAAPTLSGTRRWNWAQLGRGSCSALQAAAELRPGGSEVSANASAGEPGRWPSSDPPLLAPRQRSVKRPPSPPLRSARCSHRWRTSRAHRWLSALRTASGGRYRPGKACLPPSPPPEPLRSVTPGRSWLTKSGCRQSGPT